MTWSRLVVRRLLGAVSRPEEGSGVLEQESGSGLVPQVPLSGPAGHSAPLVGHAAWASIDTGVGASSFAIRTRL